MVMLIIGYLMGIIHKFLYSHDIVTYLYMFNMTLVCVDLFLYLKYFKENKRDLANLSNQNN